jgi:hypothetical protein
MSRALAAAVGSTKGATAHRSNETCHADVALHPLLFRTARRVDDLEALATGNPKRVERRVKNRLLGRAMGRAGFWRWLWK